MFVVRTSTTSLGTPSARDALAHFQAVARAGHAPTVITLGGKNLPPNGLQRWIAAAPAGPRRFS